MIKAGNRTIFILHADGTKSAFEVQDLQTTIINCALQTGHRDTWFAEDIALAIEYALLSTSEDTPTYSETDLNTIVVKALQETGYPEISQIFRERTGTDRTRAAIDRPFVKNIISRYLQLSGGAAERCIDAVCTACQKLGIEEASPILILELSKYFKDKQLPVESIVSFADMTRQNLSPFLVDKQVILDRLDETARQFVDHRIILLNGISRLFPALKLDIDLARYADILNFTLPFTEMLLFPHLPPLAEAVDSITEQAIALCGTGPEALPLYLRSFRSRPFMKSCFDLDWKDGEPICRELFTLLESQIKQPVYRISY